MGVLAEPVGAVAALRPADAQRDTTLDPVRSLHGREEGARQGARRECVSCPGQVNGDWAVWSRCASRSACNVVRYRISTGQSDIIDNSHHRKQHSPSVDANGTVYFASGNGGCGNRVTLIREGLDGSEEELWRLPNGDDIGRTHLQMRPHGNTVLYDEFSCGRSVESDVWQIVG